MFAFFIVLFIILSSDTCRKHLSPVLHIHIVGVVKEIGDVLGVLLSEKPDVVIAGIVTTYSPRIGQEEKKKFQGYHVSHFVEPV